TGTDVEQRDADLALVGAQRRFSSGQPFEQRVIDLDPGAVCSGDGALRPGLRGRDHMNADLEPRARHAKWVAHATFAVDDVLLRQDVQKLAIRGDHHRPRALDGLAHVVTADLARPRTESDTAAAVDAFDL